jgi:hypothetical protein
LTEVESPVEMLARRGADERAIRSPMAPARSIQRALFQLRIRPSPHWPSDRLLQARRGPPRQGAEANCQSR